MRKIKIKKEIEYWEDICKRCGKKLLSRSLDQAEYNRKRHEDACNDNKK